MKTAQERGNFGHVFPLQTPKGFLCMVPRDDTTVFPFRDLLILELLLHIDCT
jgi:hypothetical protein